MASGRDFYAGGGATQPPAATRTAAVAIADASRAKTIATERDCRHFILQGLLSPPSYTRTVKDHDTWRLCCCVGAI